MESNDQDEGLPNEFMEVLPSIIEHVFLPARLPSHANDDKIEDKIFDQYHACFERFSSSFGNGHEELRAVCRALQVYKNLRCGSDDVREKTLRHELQLLPHGVRQYLLIHIEPHNAAIIVRKDKDKPCVHFEMLEVSASNKAITNTSGRLVRHLPDATATVPCDIVHKPGFLSTLASTLTKMRNPVNNVFPQRNLAAGSKSKLLDTPSPTLVLDLLTGFLQANGKPSKLNQIKKHSRDEVIISGDCKSPPWRRSPVLQMLKMATQILLCRESQNGLWMYKQFMLYFLAHLLRLAYNAQLSSDTLWMMKAKLAKRLLKFPQSLKIHNLPMVTKAMQDVDQKIASRWQAIIQHSRKADFVLPDALVELSVQDRDTFKLKDVMDFCNKGFKKRLPAQPVPKMTYSALWSISLDNSQVLPPVLERLDSESVAVLSSNLGIFERYIQYNLDDWCSNQPEHTRPQAMTKLFHTAERYFQLASPIYATNPHAMSAMYLTILEIIIACDKMACVSLSKLSDFAIPVPADLWSTLLLGSNEQLCRLGRAEAYLATRSNDNTDMEHRTILSDFGSSKSFAVVSFSDSHRRLRDRIKVEIAQARNERKAEFNSIQEQRTEKIELSQQLPHQQITDTSSAEGQSRHDPACHTCRLEREAGDFTIEVYQCSLPSDDNLEKAVVFELNVPKEFQIWRDFMVFFLTDVLKFTTNAGNKIKHALRLDDYDGLKSRIVSVPGEQRLCVVGSAKQLRHPNRIDFDENTTLDNVVLEQKSTWSYYDARNKNTLGEIKVTDHVANSCSFSMPERSKAEQDFIIRKHCEPSGQQCNAIIAKQQGAPTHLTVNEFQSLYCMVFGHHLNWRNMLVEFASQSIDLQKQEGALVLTQMALQAGPAGDVRPSHEDLLDNLFVGSLASRLQLTVESVSQNWEACRILAVCLVIGIRLNDSCDAPVAQVQQLLTACLASVESQLHRIRNAATTESAADENGDDDAASQDRMVKHVEIALACLYMFSSDNASDRRLGNLFRESRYSQLFFECIMTVRDCHAIVNKLDAFQKFLYGCYRRFIPRAGFALTTPVTADGMLSLGETTITGLVAAIQARSPHLRNLGTWQFEYNHWLVTDAETDNCQTRRPLKFNLLTGEVYFDGLTTMFAPPEYCDTPHFNQLFGDKDVAVVRDSPATLRLPHPIHGFTVTFGLSDGELYLTAQDDTDSYLFLPRKYLEDGLPASFISEYFFWFHAETRQIHRLLGSDRSLLNVPEETLMSIEDTFRPIAMPEDIRVFRSEPSRDICISLPKLKLEFTYSPGGERIYCQQYEGAYISKNQNIDTLIGLQSFLILTYENDAKNDLLLLPEGLLGVSTDTENGLSHVLVHVSKASNYHVYDIDRHGVLRCNGDLQSHLYLATLHAKTSSCSVDPFTSRTGTQQALHILASSEVQSARDITDKQFKLLKGLAYISPKRTLGSEENDGVICQMWSDELSPLCQDSMLHSLVISLLERLRSISFSFEGSMNMVSSLDSSIRELAPHVDPKLRERDSIRLSVFRRHGFGGECHSQTSDALYQTGNSRSTSNDESSSQGMRGTSPATLERVKYACKSIRQGGSRRQFGQGFAEEMRKRLQHSDGTWGPSADRPPADFTYDVLWLSRSLDSSFHHYWCPIHKGLQKSMGSLKEYDKQIWIACLAFMAPKQKDEYLLDATIALMIHESTRQVTIPEFDRFYLYRMGSPKEEPVLKILKKHSFTFNDNDRPRLRGEIGETAYNNMQNTAVQDCARLLLSHYMDRTHSTRIINPSLSSFLRVEDAQEEVSKLLDKWLSRGVFDGYLKAVQTEIMKAPLAVFSRLQANYCQPILPLVHSQLNPQTSMSDSQLLEAHTPPALVSALYLEQLLCYMEEESYDVGSSLIELIHGLEIMVKEDVHKTAYVAALRDSIESLENTYTKLNCNETREVRQNRYEALVRLTSDLLKNMTADIDSTLRRSLGTGPRDVAIMTHYRTGMSVSMLLEQLHHRSIANVPTEWKQAIVQMGLTITEYQQAVRLASAELLEVELAELASVPSRTWDAAERPYWLLFEIHNNLRIRPCQVNMADIMLEQASNGVLQLNMGEGKTSVILPIVAMALADGESIARVITVKQQEKQALRTLINRLGGICNRRVNCLPFSRRTQLEKKNVEAIEYMFQTCAERGDIFLTVPEHQLSMELTARSLMIAEDEKINKVGEQLNNVLVKYRKHFCDIVDESDETFSPKFELIYTLGHQQPIDFAPKRWVVIHAVLKLVDIAVYSMLEDDSESFEYIATSEEQYPRIRFLNKDSSDTVGVSVADAILGERLSFLKVPYGEGHYRDCLWEFLLTEKPTQEAADTILQREYANQSTLQTLLLLRGLLACGVLDFAFRVQRWRVNYGLDPARKPRSDLAVPYAAKDIPKARAEFSHDDSIIILTSLSYYYGGLSDENLFDCIGHLQAQEDGADEYLSWVDALAKLDNTSCHIPGHYQTLVSINLREKAACANDLFPRLCYFKPVIDYFLAELVFPKQMRIFPTKLSASGWDIAAKKPHATRGFSGTKDCQVLLPLHVEQLHNDDHIHTDALVLSDLLDEDNSVRTVPESNEDSELLIEHIVVSTSSKCRVIIDAAAHINDISNRQAAYTFLEACEEHDVEVAVFFSVSGELTIIDRAGFDAPFYSSRHSRQMANCVVFLDQAHSRGTDLPFPQDWDAAVILGPDLTKDRLTQACMRMRKLGQGQSIIYFVPDEIEKKIREACDLSRESGITIKDIITWTITETWRYLARNLPLWATQGRRHEYQRSVLASQDNGTTSKAKIRKLLESEGRKLSSRYHPNETIDKVRFEGGLPDTEITRQVQVRCEEFGVDMARQDYKEEQERELAPEVEEQHFEEQQAPPKAAEVTTGEALRSFIQTGKIQSQDSHHFLYAFHSLSKTAAAKLLDMKEFPTHIVVTEDFAKTVDDENRADLFQRPVRWILTASRVSKRASQGARNVVMVIISPHEADMYKNYIKMSEHVVLHSYAPRQTLRAECLDALTLNPIPRMPENYVIPQYMTIALNLFAGQLYFSSFEEYCAVCDYLDLSWHNGQPAESDGFKRTPHDQLTQHQCKFTQSPIPFLKKLMCNIRRHSSDISRTHMGRLLDGEKLQLTDFPQSAPKRKHDDDEGDDKDEVKKVKVDLDVKYVKSKIKTAKVDHDVQFVKSEAKTFKDDDDVQFVKSGFKTVDIDDHDDKHDFEILKVVPRRSALAIDVDMYEDIKNRYTEQGIKIDEDEVMEETTPIKIEDDEVQIHEGDDPAERIWQNIERQLAMPVNLDEYTEHGVKIERMDEDRIDRDNGATQGVWQNIERQLAMPVNLDEYGYTEDGSESEESDEDDWMFQMKP